MRFVVSGHPEDVLHGGEEHPADENVLDESASATRGLDPDGGLSVDGGDVLDPDVADSAGHFAAEGDSGAVRGDAGEAADEEVLGRHPESDPVLVPSALDGDAVVAGDDEAVLDSCVGAGIWNWIEKLGMRIEEEEEKTNLNPKP